MKRKYLAGLCAAMLVAVGATGCSTSKKAAADTDRLVEANDNNMLPHNRALDALNGEWSIVNAGGNDLTPLVEADNEDSPTITFNIRTDGQGSLYCNTGCNYLNGDVTVSPATGAVSVSHLLSTMKACPDMTAEAAINAALASTAQMRIERLGDAYFLYLRDAAGAPVLTARRWDNTRLQGAWEVVQIGQENVQVADVQVVFDTDQGRMHLNTGCNVVNGTLRLLPEREGGLEITGLASTRKGCPEAVARLERDLLVAFESVAGCTMSKDAEKATLVNAAGEPLVKLHRLILLR